MTVDVSRTILTSSAFGMGLGRDGEQPDLRL
jgi:hypothetical protein